MSTGGVPQSQLEGREDGAGVQAACGHRGLGAVLLCTGGCGHLTWSPFCAQPLAPERLLRSCQHQRPDAEAGRMHLELCGGRMTVLGMP